MKLLTGSRTTLSNLLYCVNYIDVWLFRASGTQVFLIKLSFIKSLVMILSVQSHKKPDEAVLFSTKTYCKHFS